MIHFFRAKSRRNCDGSATIAISESPTLRYRVLIHHGEAAAGQ
jgi:hypothetical protein